VARARAQFDARFCMSLGSFLRICVPGVRTPEAALLVLVTALLGARSWLDLWASSNGGHVVKAIVSRNREDFVRHAVRDLTAMMIPMSVVNNSVRLCGRCFRCVCSIFSARTSPGIFAQSVK
jgi:ATP-binding cassette, subfamily D (ALD), member 3